jgi:hypothetical protein
MLSETDREIAPYDLMSWLSDTAMYPSCIIDTYGSTEHTWRVYRNLATDMSGIKSAPNSVWNKSHHHNGDFGRLNTFRSAFLYHHDKNLVTRDSTIITGEYHVTDEYKDGIVNGPLHSNISPVAAWALHEVVFYRVAAEEELNFGGGKL